MHHRHVCVTNLLISVADWLCADIADQCYANGAEVAAEPDVALLGAAAQCIHLLYGLELPERDAGFTDSFQASH